MSMVIVMMGMRLMKMLMTIGMCDYVTGADWGLGIWVVRSGGQRKLKSALLKA